MTKNNQIKKQDLVVTRIIDAQVELVWKAWTDPEYVMRWWGPQYYTSPTCKIDLREGGKYVFCMRAPKDQGGQDMYTAGVYKKIVPMERLEFTQGMADNLHSVPFHFLITNYSSSLIYSKYSHQIPPISKFSSDFYPVL